MIVTIHQPDFLPWLGFFDRWAKSDLYVVLDDVQFIRCGWHHRDKIKTVNGPKWLTIPVLKKAKYNQLIRDSRIDNSTSWRDDHLKTIKFNYKKAPNFEHCLAKIEGIYNKRHSLLMDLNMELLHFVAGELGIKVPVVFASDYNIKSASSQRLVDLVKSVNGSTYLTGAGSKGYLDEDIFFKEGIKVVWQEYTQPVYKQLHGEFVPMLSSLDYLMMMEPALKGEKTFV